LIINSSNVEKLEARAREDARLGVYNPEAYVIATLGPQPAFDPVGNYRHGEVGSRLQNPAIEEIRQDIRREEDDRARHASALLLVAFLMVLLFMESAGAIYVMRALGVESPERVIFGTALAVCIFFVTWLCSRARNRIASIGAILALGALISAVTLIRVDESGGEEGSKAVDFATAIIMMAVTVGPAVMAEHVLRQLGPIMPALRRVLRLRGRLNAAVLQQKRANRFVAKLADKREAWQNESARLRALYDIAYRAARAELGDQSAKSSSIPPWVTPESERQMRLSIPQTTTTDKEMS
jgi:hypothetical protein